jgi:hypothetical protein
MGGFVSRNGHHTIVKQQLEQHPEYISAIQSVRVEDIRDKSKGDALSKGVALIQGLWFMAQCLARVHQHIPVTELEVATLAFSSLPYSSGCFGGTNPLKFNGLFSSGLAMKLSKAHRPGMGVCWRWSWP